MKILASVCARFALFVLIAPQLLGFGEYKDHEGHQIAFKIVMPEELTTEKKIFVQCFVENYSTLEPQQIKPHFTSHDDTRRLLKRAFKEEIVEVQDMPYPIRWIDILKDNTVIGFAVFEECLLVDPGVWHIRQMAILPSEQHHGYGRHLIDSIKKIETVGTITADTRILNARARAAYKKYGFSELETPHDSELSSEYYLGLKWVEG